MPCTGHCFDVPHFQPQPVSNELDEEVWAAPIVEPSENYTYSSLKPWQTRILCLHPSQDSSLGKKSLLCADLLVATVSDTEGIVIEESGQIVEYIALSYTWGYPELSETLVCNKKRRPISKSNAAALVALRSSEHPTYIWIDAICINQEDLAEKSAQVARMLSIYKKARSVTAWLGESDTDSVLAFACCRMSMELQVLVSRTDRTAHTPPCFARLRVIYLAILSLYRRPWLRRTWIRQEIFGARRLTVQCGLQQISWDQFIQAANLMKPIKTLLGDEVSVSEQEEAKLWRLLNDAQKNVEVSFGGFKAPRDLLDVLLQSQDFEVTETHDTFYAILGMCNITASTITLAAQVQYQKDAVMVDYKKSTAEVYHDASLCILRRKGEPINLARLWHSYKRSPLHDMALPSWAVDWRSGTFDGAYQTALTCALRLDTLQVPLTGGPGEDDGQDGVADDEMTRVWHWPETIESDSAVLRVRARVLNYVAHLMDFTCEPGIFVKDDSGSRNGINLTGRAIHCRKMQLEPGAENALVSPQPEWEEFNPRAHLWRLAILGVGRDSQLCLVPSTTQKGDLVIAIAPEVLAMVISPMQGDGTVSGLIPRDDPYENLTKDPLSMYESMQTTVVILMIVCAAMLPLIIGFNIAMILVEEGSSAGTIVVACYGATLTLTLVSYVTYGYLTMLELDWEGMVWVSRVVFALICGISFGFALFFTTGRRQMFVAIFFGVTMATLPIKFFWELYRKIDHQMEVALLREDVFEHLAGVTQKLGHDYTFKGPLLVESYTYHWHVWTLPNLLRVRGIRWFVFIVAMKVYSITKRRPKLGRERFRWFLSEVCTLQALENPSVWDRPIQEFRIH